MDEINKALYALFQCRDIADLAIDIYWGNHNHFEEEEKEAFEGKDYDEAYHLACLEMIERVRYGNDFPYKNPEDPADDSPAWDKMICAISDLYGKHLRLIHTNKSLKGGQAEIFAANNNNSVYQVPECPTPIAKWCGNCKNLGVLPLEEPCDSCEVMNTENKAPTNWEPKNIEVSDNE